MMTLGIDPGSKRVAVASLHDNGTVDYDTYDIPDDLRGARRLRYTRELLLSELRRFEQVAVIVVEIPWANPKTGSNFVLLSLAGILLEASQAAHPGAVVIDMPTQVWKRESVGTGNASKQQCMDHALALGLPVADQDVADALCMAQAGWASWWRRSSREEAA